MTIHLPRLRPALRAAAALLACLLLPAPPALASQVVQVRVGNHPEFTRVVFELDAPARYRVEKRDGENPELVVTIDAASRPRTIRSKSQGIEAVQVTSEGQRSVARVALRKPGLRLKEMILANPSRIVLDLVHGAAPKPVAKTPPAPEPAPKPEPVVKLPEPAPKPEPVAKLPEPAPKPEPVAKTPAPKPEPVAKVPEPVVAPKPEPVAKAPSAPPEAVAPKPEPPPAPAATPPKPIAPVAKPVAPKPKPAPVAKPTAPEPPKQAETSEGPPMEILAGIAVGVLLCVVGLVVLLRRRRPGRDEADALGDEAADGDAEQRSFTEMVFSETGGEVSEAPAEAGGVSDLDSFFDDDSAADEQLASRGDDVMQQGISDLPTDRGGAPAGPGPIAATSPDPDVLRVVHELERRMGQLEGKLTESNEARERLERQVAAQSEELRVQRAAIARTQRALRSLSRGDEDKATEPALRDDDTQAKTRINV
jgi:hypothetical protein